MKYPTTTYINWKQTPEGWFPRKEAKRRGLIVSKKQKSRAKKVAKREAR